MNKFDSANYPTGVPSELIAGDRWAWKNTEAATVYGSGYTITYELVLIAGGTPETLTATLTDSEYRIEVAAATTAGYAAGEYQWAEFITRDSDSERIRLNWGTLTVKADPASSLADSRSHARVVYDAIKAVIEDRATKDQESYTVAGRSLGRTPIPDLLLLHDRYKNMVQREEKAEKVRAGLSTGNQIVVRMR